VAQAIESLLFMREGPNSNPNSTKKVEKILERLKKTKLEI
jgi:hypothetical protein